MLTRNLTSVLKTPKSIVFELSDVLQKRTLQYSSVSSKFCSIEGKNKNGDEFPHKVGFIGAGNMAKAIGFSSLDSGLLRPDQMIVSDPTPSQFEPWKQRNVASTEDNVEVVNFADIILVAAPPQFFDRVINSLQSPKLSVNYQKCFVSTMVGKTVHTLEQAFGTVAGLKVAPQVIRVTPNTPAMVGAGCSIMVCDETAKYSQLVQKLLKASGSCEVIPEELMNACSGVSGSGPAYIYLVIEALTDGAVRMGVPRAAAYRLAAQTVIGAGQMVLKTGKHPGQLKDEVCSRGGTTISGIHALETGSVRSSFINAVVAATKRAEELQ